MGKDYFINKVVDRVWDELFSKIKPEDYGFKTDNFEENIKNWLVLRSWSGWLSNAGIKVASLDYEANTKNNKTLDEEFILQDYWTSFVNEVTYYHGEGFDKNSQVELLLSEKYAVPEHAQTPEFKEKLLAYSKRFSLYY